MPEEKIDPNINQSSLEQALNNLPPTPESNATEQIPNKEQTPSTQQETIAKQSIQQAQKQNLGQGGLGGLSKAQKEHLKHLKEIESVMEKNIENAYMQMPEAKQKKFKIQGEKTAIKINKLLNQAKVQAKKIIKLIRKWLTIIPGVNQFFLEQASKIKADEILRLRNNW